MKHGSHLKVGFQMEMKDLEAVGFHKCMDRCYHWLVMCRGSGGKLDTLYDHLDMSTECRNILMRHEAYYLFL
jgi:hypothetical protein